MPVPIPMGGANLPTNRMDPRTGPWANDGRGHNFADPNDPYYKSQPDWTFDPTLNGGRWRFTNQPNPITGEDPNRVIGSDPVTDALGIGTPVQMNGAPGSTLDTSQPDAERSRMQVLLQQLQSQAQTGGGAWQSALASGLQGANATAQ